MTLGTRSSRQRHGNNTHPPTHPLAPHPRRRQAAAMRLAAAVLAAALLLLLTAAPSQQTTDGAELRSLLTAAGAWVQRAGGPAAEVAAAVAAAAVSSRAASPLPKLVPVKRRWRGSHDLYYQVIPGRKPLGLLLILHKCGRSGSDHWPRSAACPECTGLPESLSKTKQALTRGYVVAALSSYDRSIGPGARCFSWHTDAEVAADIVRKLPRQLRLPAGTPVYLNGASSGGSLALRLPGIVTVQGVVGEVIAPPAYASLLAKGMAKNMPPALYIHMPEDGGMAPKVAENLAALRALGLPAEEIRVMPRAMGPGYFADRSPLVSSRLSAALLSKLQQFKLVDANGWITVDLKDAGWNVWKDWLAGAELRKLLRTIRAEQAEQDVSLLTAHIWECLAVAWARHETIGEYTTAALAWLESKGTADINWLVQRYVVEKPSALWVDPPPSPPPPRPSPRPPPPRRSPPPPRPSPQPPPPSPTPRPPPPNPTPRPPAPKQARV